MVKTPGREPWNRKRPCAPGRAYSPVSGLLGIPGTGRPQAAV